MKLKGFDSSYFCGKNFFGDGGSQSMLVYQPTLDTLELENARALIIILVWNQRGYKLLWIKLSG